MPQELRHPAFVRSEVNFDVTKLIKTRNLLSDPGIIQRGLQDLVLDTIWPNRSIEESGLIIESILFIDNIYTEFARLQTDEKPN